MLQLPLETAFSLGVQLAQLRDKWKSSGPLHALRVTEIENAMIALNTAIGVSVRARIGRVYITDHSLIEEAEYLEFAAS